METKATTPQPESRSTTDAQPGVAPAQTLLLGLLFGLIFGFLLQKGGVAKYHVLIGQLLLEDFTVLKVMLSAVLVGALGIYGMHRAGMVEMHIKPTRYASNIIGGLVFGVGFALSAYCPGTGAAAVGQGNYDAWVMMLGMVGGSYLFAEMSAWISRHVDTIGDRGEITLYDLLPINRLTVFVSSLVLIGGVLAAVEYISAR